MTKIENGEKIFSFAVPNDRADAIMAVSELYKGKLRTLVVPMRSAEDGETIARKVFQPIETVGAGGYNRNIAPIVDRYRELGESGTASLVRMAVREGEKIDFQTFHEEVDDLLDPDMAEPKIV